MTTDNLTSETRALLAMFTGLYTIITAQGYPAQLGNYCLPGLPWVIVFEQGTL